MNFVFTVIILIPFGIASAHQPQALSAFIPSKPGCNINWILESGGKCDWCEKMFDELVKGLVTSYHTSTINTISDKSTASSKNDKQVNTRASCFINWLLANDYAILNDILGSSCFGTHLSNDWFMFVNVLRKRVFMSHFETAIDKDFGNRLPRTVVVALDPETFLQHQKLHKDGLMASADTGMTFAQSSYLCPDFDAYLDWTAKHSDPWKILDNAKPAQGYGAAVTTFGDDPFENGNVLIETGFQQLEDQFFESWRPNPAAIRPAAFVILGAVAKHLNFSHTVEKAFIQNPCLLTCFNCRKSPSFERVVAIVLSTDVSSFVYCRKENMDRQTAVILSVMAPFDVYTWLALLLSFILLWLLPSFRWKILSLLASLLGQGSVVKKYDFPTIMYQILLIPIQAAFLTYLTSNAVKAFLEPFFESNQDLFDGGYKIIMYNRLTATQFSKAYMEEFNIPFTNLKLDLENVPQYFTECTNLKDHQPRHRQLAFKRGEGTTTVDRRWKDIFVPLAETVKPGTSCHMLEETWDENSKALYLSGHLAKPAYIVLHRLLSAGLDEYWTTRQISTDFRRSKKISMPDIDSSDEEIALMNVSMGKYIAGFGILMSANTMVFFIELAILAKLVVMCCQYLELAERLSYICSISFSRAMVYLKYLNLWWNAGKVGPST